nr:ABC transporter ATP-binding protein [Shewanella intestini]
MLISCQNLTKNFGDKKALNEVSFTLEAGTPIALVGPNGAGKTTLFSILCGYILPSKGKVNILGQQPGSRELQGRVAALPQDALLDPNFSIITQLSFFAQLQGMTAKAAKIETKRVLELVDMTEAANLKPISLSHGMSKRVAIAQALIGQPEVVLLDEPTAGLDPANAKKIREIVQNQSINSTFIISSHNLDELEKLCDTVLYLESGQLQQSVSMQSEQSTEYITLTLQQADFEQLQSTIGAIDSVINVKPISHDQLLIEHNKSLPYYIERALLDLFEQNQWQYKSILKGRTLEDTLFSN